jgi:hypothetical protein
MDWGKTKQALREIISRPSIAQCKSFKKKHVHRLKIAKQHTKNGLLSILLLLRI